ncbi:hypothetical protein NC651_014697 [Populus alba x Populus x berolinensis]|nr:hypothetical protein NC651_014697 [Populus alba x Populus x berolinensis]
MSDVKVKVDNANDLSPHNEPGNVSPKVSSEAGHGNRLMNEGKDSEAENEDASAFDEGVLQENENLESNEVTFLLWMSAQMGMLQVMWKTKMASKEAGLSVGDRSA